MNIFVTNTKLQIVLKINLDLIFKMFIIKFKGDKNYLTKHLKKNIYFLGKNNFKEFKYSYFY